MEQLNHNLKQEAIEQCYRNILENSENEEDLLFVLERATLEFVVEMAQNVECFLIQDSIIERLKAAGEQIKVYFPQLIHSKLRKISCFCIEIIDLKEIIDLACHVNFYYVENAIIKRLEKEKDHPLLKKNFSKLAMSDSPTIRKFAAKYVEDETILDMAVNETDLKVIDVLKQRLVKGNKVVRENYARLINAKSFQMRKFLLELKPEITIVIEMALREYPTSSREYWSFEREIVSLLEKEKENPKVKENYQRLSCSPLSTVREFVAKEIDLVGILEMATKEKDGKIIDIILDKLEAEEQNDLVKNHLPKLLMAPAGIIQSFAAKRVELSLLETKIDTDDCSFVANTIAGRLLEEKESEWVKTHYDEIANSFSEVIRIVAVEIVPKTTIIKMAVKETEDEVLSKIEKRLEGESNFTRQEYKWLMLVKSANILSTVVIPKAPFDMVMDLALSGRYLDCENSKMVDDAIIVRFEKEKDNPILQENCELLVHVKSSYLLELLVKIMPMEFVILVALLDKRISSVDSIISIRFYEERENELLKKNFVKLLKIKNDVINDCLLDIVPFETLQLMEDELNPFSLEKRKRREMIQKGEKEKMIKLIQGEKDIDSLKTMIHRLETEE